MPKRKKKKKRGLGWLAASDVPCRSEATSKSSDGTIASQIRFFYLAPSSPAPIHRAMSMTVNNNSQNQNSIQGVGTTSTPLPAPARSQKDGSIGNSSVGTFGVRYLFILLPQVLTIEEIGQVRVGPNAQGLRHRYSSQCCVLTDVMFTGWCDHGCCKRRTGIATYLPFRMKWNSIPSGSHC